MRVRGGYQPQWLHPVVVDRECGWRGRYAAELSWVVPLLAARMVDCAGAGWEVLWR